MQDHQYDVVVIGSGPSGRTVSLRSAKKGYSVALIESELVGEDCHYRACIPSKALLRPPEALTAARQVEGAKLPTDEYSGHARIIVDEDRHVIVGATFIGPQVGELLHSATIAMIGEVPLDRLWHAIPAFPTVSEIWINLLENYGF